MGTFLPLLRDYAPDAPLLWRGDQPLSQSRFLGEVARLAAVLPTASHAINLCEDRGNFLLAFAAAIQRGQASLLPQSRAPGAVREVARAYPGSYVLTDTPFENLGLAEVRVEIDGAAFPGSGAPKIREENVAAIAFTSGSTGGPQPHVKSWRNLAVTAGMCAERFLGAQARAAGAQVNIVATVPPQHMYGLELTVMMALAGRCAIHAGRPLFPADVKAALEQVPAPRLLVTTPVHLKALAASGLAFPPIEKIISATAPLTPDLARLAEKALGAQVFEIYGCTEAGSMCTRRTLDGDRWRPYPGLRMRHSEGMTHVSGPHLDAPVATPDVIESHEDGTITLLGRAADMIKVAGKRASLVALTGRLLAIEGVEDGVVFMPDPERAELRPAAVVVAPQLSEAQVLEKLADAVDPVFLPRPLKRVERLPRNALGKLPRADLLALLKGP